MIGLYITSFGNDEVGNIELDAVIDETHEWTAEATSNPVETGAPVTDHVIEHSDKLTLNCFITDTPLIASENLQGEQDGSEEQKTQQIFNLLNDLIKSRQPVTVYTRFKNYENMVLTSVNITRNSSTGEALEFKCDFLHIRKVETQTVDVPAGISAKADSKKDSGGKSGKNSKIGQKSSQQAKSGKKQTEKKEDKKPMRSQLYDFLNKDSGSAKKDQFKSNPPSGAF